MGFPAGTVEWQDTAPKRYRSSQDVERSFCPDCGSTIGFYRVHETNLAVGSFDDPNTIATGIKREAQGGYDDCHVYHADRISWFETKDDRVRFDAHSEVRVAELRELSSQEIKG